MAKGGKARTIIVRMISTAQTGFFYTTKRVRLNSPKLSAVKYDPVVKARSFHVLCNDTTVSLTLDQSYTLQLNRTHLLFIPPLHLAHDPNSPGAVVQVCLRGDDGQGDIFSIAQAPITRTIETLLAGHVNALHELPERVVVKEVVPGHTLIGVRKPWTYGRGKRFYHGITALHPAEHKWIFHFKSVE